MGCGGSREIVDVDKVNMLNVDLGRIDPAPTAACLTGDTAASKRPKNGKMTHFPMPGDNSCLYHSISFVCNGQTRGLLSARRQRLRASQAIGDDPVKYNEAILGLKPAQYQEAVLDDNSWGGAIELGIFTEFFECEIFSFDVTKPLLYTFGTEQNYRKRVFLMYFGNHYDAIGFTVDNAKSTGSDSDSDSSSSSSSSEDDSDDDDAARKKKKKKQQKIVEHFDVNDTEALLMARKLVEETYIQRYRSAGSKHEPVVWSAHDNAVMEKASFSDVVNAQKIDIVFEGTVDIEDETDVSDSSSDEDSDIANWSVTATDLVVEALSDDEDAPTALTVTAPQQQQQPKEGKQEAHAGKKVAKKKQPKKAKKRLSIFNMPPTGGLTAAPSTTAAAVIAPGPKPKKAKKSKKKKAKAGKASKKKKIRLDAHKKDTPAKKKKKKKKTKKVKHRKKKVVTRTVKRYSVMQKPNRDKRKSYMISKPSTGGKVFRWADAEAMALPTHAEEQEEEDDDVATLDLVEEEGEYFEDDAMQLYSDDE